MIWRLILAIVLLGVVVGGIVGFNLFRDKMIAGYFAGMQPPPVTVSTIEVEPITWKPGLEAIGTARAAQGVELGGRDRRASSRTILFQANDEVEGRPAPRPDRRRRSSAPTSPPPRPSSTSPRPSSQRARELRERGVTAINDLDVAQAGASSARSQVVKLTAVMNQKSLEAPFGGIIGIPQVDVGQYVDARHGLRDAAGPRQHAGRLLDPRAGHPAHRHRHAGDGLDRGRQHRAHRPDLGDRAEDRPQQPPRHRPRRGRRPRRTASTPASSCGCGSSCPRSRT